MEIQTGLILAALAMPIILVPAVFIWFLIIGGIVTFIKEARTGRTVHEKNVGTVAKIKAK
jgi:hypothetical protein